MKFIRLIAVLLIASFCAQDISWAAPGIASFVASEVMLKPVDLNLTPDYAKISETYSASGGEGSAPRLIIHIQDAHANFGAQQNIAKALEELISRYKIQTVFVEGGTKDDSLNFLRPLASHEVRERVAKKYLRMGEISGAEYLDLLPITTCVCWGSRTGSCMVRI